MNNQTEFKKTGWGWDTKEASFYWNIFLDPNYISPEGYKNKISLMTGYSKKIGQSENLDRTRLLEVKLMNLHSNGYFTKALRIDWYMRHANYINKATDPCILQTFAKSYTIPVQNHEFVFNKWGKFLENFYYRVNNNLSLEGLVKKDYKKQISKDWFIDPANFNFKDVGQLYKHAATLSTQGHPDGAISAFIVKYKTLKQWQ